MATILTDTNRIDLTTATGKPIHELPVSVWAALENCDRVLRQHGMQMMLFCERCLSAGHPQARITSGDESNSGHAQTATEFRLICPHLERRIRLSVQ
jgi:hypothetical protein